MKRDIAESSGVTHEVVLVVTQKMRDEHARRNQKLPIVVAVPELAVKPNVFDLGNLDGGEK